jgi:hypothetical protein
MLGIPDPCHEDFSKMSPTQRGAFCSKCEIDTFDFRNLSDQQVNKIFLENKGQHLCGQFTKRQLNSLNQGYLDWKNQNTQTFKSKFVLALVLVFGVTLFSCQTQKEQEILTQHLTEFTEIAKEKGSLKGVVELEDVNLLEYINEGVIDGMVTFEVEEITCEKVLEDDYSLGGVSMIAGGVGMKTTDYYTYLEATDSAFEEPIIDLYTDAISDKFVGSVYPNPTRDNATLKLEVVKSAEFTIAVFDLSGRFITSIYKGPLTEGTQTFPVDLSYQQTGMYIVTVASSTGQNESLKVQKLQ